MGQQVTRSQLAHLARTYQINALTLQVAKDFLGQVNRHRRDGHRCCRNRSFVAHPLGDGEGAREQSIELRVDRANSARRSIRFLDLTQNLRLAHNHRIKACGDPEDMTHSVALVMFIQILAIGFGIEAVKLAQEAVHIGGAIRSSSQHFHPVAGGNDHAFLDTGIGRQALYRFRQARLGDGKPLAHFDRCGLVVHADDDEVHERNLCVRLKLLAAHAPKAMMKAKVARNAARRPRHPELQRVYNNSMYTAHMMNDNKIFGS